MLDQIRNARSPNLNHSTVPPDPTSSSVVAPQAKLDLHVGPQQQDETPQGPVSAFALLKGMSVPQPS